MCWGHTCREELNEYDPFDDGSFCRSRFWLFVSYMVSFASIVGAVWVLLQHYGGWVGAPRACWACEWPPKGSTERGGDRVSHGPNILMHDCRPQPTSQRQLQPTTPMTAADVLLCVSPRLQR